MILSRTMLVYYILSIEPQKCLQKVMFSKQLHVNVSIIVQIFVSTTMADYVTIYFTKEIYVV